MITLQITIVINLIKYVYVREMMKFILYDRQTGKFFVFFF